MKTGNRCGVNRVVKLLGPKFQLLLIFSTNFWHFTNFRLFYTTSGDSSDLGNTMDFGYYPSSSLISFGWEMKKK